MTRQLSMRFEAVTYLPAADAGTLRAQSHRARMRAARLAGRRSLPHMRPQELRRRCRGIEQSLEATPVDVILAITVDHLVAYLETAVPIVHHSDTTFDGIENSYEHVTGLLPSSRRQGHEIARRAIARSLLNTYPSRWAARLAIETYGADPARTHVVPYGANLAEPPPRREALDVTARDRCRLLFIGRDWVRKGGPLAFDAFLELRSGGVDAEMTVVGTDPGVSHEHLEVIPFLNKQRPDQLARYHQLWRSSAFLFMPSRAETFGAIYCEAAANGMPAIATDVGGVGDAIADGTTGRLLSPDATADDYAETIAAIWGDRDRYAEYVRNARLRYETDLNWDVWADRTTRLITDALRTGSEAIEGAPEP